MGHRSPSSGRQLWVVGQPGAAPDTVFHLTAASVVLWVAGGFEAQPQL